jgi:hypothetical protein
MKQSLASLPALCDRARLRIGGRGVRLARAALPMKVCLPVGQPPSAGGSSPPRLGLMLFIDDAQAPISVPNRFTSGCARTLAAMSPSNSRSRFLENFE